MKSCAMTSFGRRILSVNPPLERHVSCGRYSLSRCHSTFCSIPCITFEIFANFCELIRKYFTKAVFLSVECSQTFQDRHFQITETKQEKQTQSRPSITEKQTRTTLGGWRIHTTAELSWRLHMSWAVKRLAGFPRCDECALPGLGCPGHETREAPKRSKPCRKAGHAPCHFLPGMFGLQCFPVQNSCNERRSMCINVCPKDLQHPKPPMTRAKTPHRH